MRRLFLGGLKEGASRTELEREFGTFGPLQEVWVARRPPGFGFILFDDPRHAETALREMNGQYICGGRIRVEMARDDGAGRSRASGGGGRSGGYGGGGRSGDQDYQSGGGRYSTRDVKKGGSQGYGGNYNNDDDYDRGGGRGGDRGDTRGGDRGGYDDRGNGGSGGYNSNRRRYLYFLS